MEKNARYWGELSQAQILDAVHIAKEKGYRAALDFLVRKHPTLSTYFKSGVRIDWIFHCYNQNRRSRCLDLGSGWGSLSFLLTNFFDETVSLELDSILMSFLRLRSREDKTRSLKLVMGDNLSLPFPDSLFDLVVANGTLEWAARGREGNPRSIQLRHLKEARRCLKPGGCLYIGIENRFGLTNWLGARDHTSLPYTSILPRKAADLVVSHALRDQGWTKYDTYTYSSRGYRSLLKEAGFAPVELLWTYPSYNYPKFAGRIDDGHSYAFLARHHRKSYEDMSILKKLACIIGEFIPSRILGEIAPKLWPSYLIFAWNGFKPKTIEDKVADAVTAASLVRMSGGDALSSKVSFLALEDDEVRVFAKLPRCLRDQSLKNESHLLAKYAGISPSSLSLDGPSLFIERPIPGRLCTFHGMEDNQKAIEWLLAFQDETASKPYTDAEARSELTNTISALSDLLPSDVVETTNVQIEKLLSILVSERVPKCSEHGDFFAKNMIFSDNGTLSVLDWELYRASGNPIFDFCFFIINNCLRPKAERSFYDNLIGLGGYSPVMSKLVRRFCAHKRVPVAAFVFGIPYTMSRCTLRYSIYSDIDSPLQNQFRHLLTLWNERMTNFDFSWIENSG